MAELSFRNICKKYSETEVVSGFNLEVSDHEFIVFLGPSGCGKSTILRMIAGLEDITGGELSIDAGGWSMSSRRATATLRWCSRATRSIPHMSVRDNISFGLRRMKIGPDEVDRRVSAAAATLGLEQFLDRKSTAHFGGQQQRGAIARAIVKTPGVFLFDGPLSNLDARLRHHMRVEIARLHQRLKTTTVYVAHDQLEAMTLADRIVLLRNGLIEQVGTPREIFDRPNTQFVAAFIGTPAMNFFEVDVNGSELNAPGRNAPALVVNRDRFDLDGSKTALLASGPLTSAPQAFPTSSTSSTAMSTSSNSLAMTL
jgi:multiple sugar transport system ATP-binding protein